MENLSILLSLLFVYSTINGQTQFTVTPSPASESGLSSDPFIKAISTVENTSTSTLEMKWIRTSTNLPAAWETSVCDLIKCHIPSSSEANFTLMPGQSGTMSVWFIPNGEVGTAEVQILIYNVMDSLNNHFVNTYNATATTSTSIRSPVEQDYHLFPNPATDLVYLPDSLDSDIYLLEIYNVLGERVHQVNYTSLTSFSLAINHFQDGAYFFRFLDKDLKTLSSQRVVKI